jgi:hypothetical protein
VGCKLLQGDAAAARTRNRQADNSKGRHSTQTSFSLTFAFQLAPRCRRFAVVDSKLEPHRNARDVFLRPPIHQSVISNVNKTTTAALMHKSFVCWLNPFPFGDLEIALCHAASSITISGVRVIRPTSPNRFE